MNKKEILEKYEIKVNEHGIIVSPGKFEGEMFYVPYFYDQDPDKEEYQENKFYIRQYFFTKEEIDLFHELAGFDTIILWESDQGFCYSKVFNRI